MPAGASGKCDEPHTENEMDEKVKAAREEFDRINDVYDGAGLVVSDCDLLAESIAAEYGVEPEQVYDHYEPLSDDEEDDEDEVSDNGYELSDGGVIEFPEDDGTIRRRDVHGNCEEIRRPGDQGWEEWVDLLKAEWSVVNDDTVVKGGFSTPADAWAWIESRPEAEAEGLAVVADSTNSAADRADAKGEFDADAE